MGYWGGGGGKGRQIMKRGDWKIMGYRRGWLLGFR